MAQTIKLKRAYDRQEKADGYRIYVDRLWPRGLSHETFHYDLWDKDIAPSTDLREYFHADPDSHWSSFEERYEAELRANPAFVALKKAIADKPVVTLLYSSHDPDRNNAVVLRTVLSDNQ